jgi:hypothetical protein
MMTGHFYTGEAGDPLGRHGGTSLHRRLQLLESIELFIQSEI